MKGNGVIVGYIARNRLTGQRTHAGTVTLSPLGPVPDTLRPYNADQNLPECFFTREPFHLVYAISTHINEWESKSIHSHFLFGMGY